MMRSRGKSATLGAKKGAAALIPIAENPTSFEEKKISRFPAGERTRRTHQPEAEEEEELSEWEVRPGGMLVQKRDPDAHANAKPLPPPIRVRVKYDHVYHEILISPQASFGELKKLLSAQLGLHPQDQKILFKDREKDPKDFLDISGVKDRSKMVLVQDSTAQAKRFLEMRKNAKMEKAAKAISHISHEVDKLASQVSLLDKIVSKGKNVAEKDVVGLIEQLMNLLVKLDGIVADGDAKLQRGMQVKRVQKCVETLDMLKMKNAMPKDEAKVSPLISTAQPQQPNDRQQKPYPTNKESESPATKKWEMFDLLSSGPIISSASSTTATPITTTSNTTSASTHIPRFDWEMF